MRYPDAHKADIRQSLLQRASRLARRDGIARLSVARVMASAKMTVGGFYKHFGSQEALVGEALAEGMRDARVRLFSGLEELKGAAFERALVERYLSLPHFEGRERGCPVAANVSELSRLPPAATTLLTNEIASLVAFVEERVLPRPTASARAWMLLSCCVGGISLARSLGGQRGPRVLKMIRSALIDGLQLGLQHE